MSDRLLYAGRVGGAGDRLSIIARNRNPETRAGRFPLFFRPLLAHLTTRATAPCCSGGRPVACLAFPCVAETISVSANNSAVVTRALQEIYVLANAAGGRLRGRLGVLTPPRASRGGPASPHSHVQTSYTLSSALCLGFGDPRIRISPPRNRVNSRCCDSNILISENSNFDASVVAALAAALRSALASGSSPPPSSMSALASTSNYILAKADIGVGCKSEPQLECLRDPPGRKCP
ncbi:hypothetical protein C8R45DRAFT_1111862 [Mycena sanguinolenta]|nr:hypothetical protein C8R45DRAFT_1111862 [Mycena sanguinolenta]